MHSHGVARCAGMLLSWGRAPRRTLAAPQAGGARRGASPAGSRIR